MPKKPGFLESLSVPSPCPTDWDSMIGDERTRYCSQCDKQVYNFSKMTRSQAEALVARMDGRLCARILRGPDGLVVTEDEQPGVRLISRRASPIATAIVAAMVGISGSAVAQTPIGAGDAVAARYIYSIDKTNAHAQLPDVPASIEGVVTDTTGAVIAGAKVTLVSAATNESRATVSSDEGKFVFTTLEASTYSVTVESPGFMPATIQEINLRPNDQVKLDVPLQAGLLGEVVTVGLVAVQTETLRTLYEGSEMVVVARVGKSVEVGKEKDDESVMMKTALHISSYLKDAQKAKRVFVHHWGWQEHRKLDNDINEGDTILVFLNRRKDGKDYEVNGASQGAKKLSKHDLGIYTSRIKELFEILAGQTPESDEVIEWLVRCAEVPATRWEGAYELANRTMSALTNYAAPDCKKVDAGADADDSTDCEAELASQRLSERLTPQQKERLVAALLSAQPVTEQDEELIQIVKEFEDARLLPFLISQLQLLEADPSEYAEQLMSHIDDLMEDDEITELYDEYHELASLIDEAEEEEGEEAEEESEESEEQEPPLDVAAAKQQRNELIKKFLAAVERKMAEQVKAN